MIEKKTYNWWLEGPVFDFEDDPATVRALGRDAGVRLATSKGYQVCDVEDVAWTQGTPDEDGVVRLDGTGVIVYEAA